MSSFSFWRRLVDMVSRSPGPEPRRMSPASAPVESRTAVPSPRVCSAPAAIFARPEVSPAVERGPPLAESPRACSSRSSACEPIEMQSPRTPLNGPCERFPPLPSMAVSVYCVASPSKQARADVSPTRTLFESPRESPREQPRSPATTICVDSPREVSPREVSPREVSPREVSPARTICPDSPIPEDASVLSCMEARPPIPHHSTTMSCMGTRRSSDSSVELISVMRSGISIPCNVKSGVPSSKWPAVSEVRMESGENIARGPISNELSDAVDDSIEGHLDETKNAACNVDDPMEGDHLDETTNSVCNVDDPMEGDHLDDTKNAACNVDDPMEGDHLDETKNADDPVADERQMLPRSDGLYPHQVVGVEWLASIYQKRAGCILADDMGLGKTVQVCAFLAMVRARSVLMVMPVSLIGNWQVELEKWCPSLRVTVFHGTKTRQAKALNMGSSGVLITSYETLGKCFEDLLVFTVTPGPAKKKAKVDDDEIDIWVDPFADEPLEVGTKCPWDVVVFDEAQRLKNPSTLVGKAAHMVQARTRISLSGTPIQNNLLDLWAIMDVCVPGLLGNLQRFRLSFVDPIDRGLLRSSTSCEVDLKNTLAEQLRELIKPFLLRRTKDEVNILLDVKKTEIVLWVRPSKIQADIYRRVLNQSADIRSITATNKIGLEVFRAVNMLKKICNTPMLAHPDASDWAKLVGCAGGEDEALPEELTDPSSQSASQEANDMIVEMISSLGTDMHCLIEQSAKLQVLIDLLPQLLRKGHRIVIFSASTKMCDLITVTVLRPMKARFLRIDGKVDQQTREVKINAFQASDDYSIFLASTQVGGVGLTLHGADRVILVDPAWNPATDAQAVDRVFRIGQVRDVVAYRLICSGMIEEKMFRLQVYKMSISNSALGSSSKSTRYFSKNDIRALFELNSPELLATKKRMEEKHGPEDLTTHVFDEDCEDARNKRWCLGCSDFSRLFSSLDDEVNENDGGVDDSADMRELLEACSRKLADATQEREVKQRQLDIAQQQFNESDAQCREGAKERKDALENYEKLKKGLKAAKKLATQQQQLLDNRDRDLQKADRALAQAQKTVEARQQVLDALEIKLDEAQSVAVTCKNDFSRCADDVSTFPDSAEGRELAHAFRTAYEAVEGWQVKVDTNPDCTWSISSAARAADNLDQAVAQLIAFKRNTGLKHAHLAFSKAQAKRAQLQAKMREAMQGYTVEKETAASLSKSRDSCYELREKAATSSTMARRGAQELEEELQDTESLLERQKELERIAKETAETFRNKFVDLRKLLIACKKQEQDAVRERRGKEDEWDCLKRKHAEFENAKKSNLEDLKAESYEADQVDRLYKRRKKDKRNLQAKCSDTP